MKLKVVLFLILGIDLFLLFLQIGQLSISSAEIDLLYTQDSYIALLYKGIFAIFGTNDYALRLPILLLHSTNFILFYILSSEYLQNMRDRIWIMLLYVMLPGILSSAIVLSHASFVLFGLLLFFFVRNRIPQYALYIILFIFSILDGGFGYLFLGLFIYALIQKHYKEALLCLIYIIVSASLYGYYIYGIPRGHFLDTLAVYSAIMTPIVFIYIVYILYRRFLAQKQDVLWYVSSVALVFSLLLSFRQRLEIEYIAPYLIIALPLAATTFRHSYHVRLKQFRKRYKLLFIFGLVFLIANTLVVLSNKKLFNYLENPRKHFAYNMYVAKELANELLRKGINCVTTDTKMQKRLAFYGVGECKTIYLDALLPTSHQHADVTIRYSDTPVYKANVTKINIK